MSKRVARHRKSRLYPIPADPPLRPESEIPLMGPYRFTKGRVIPNRPIIDTKTAPAAKKE